MRISVFGLGYVGCVTAACLAQDGNEIIGVDVQQAKVDTILAGKSPIVEPGLDELIAKGIASERLTAVTSARDAIMQTDLSLICVGTPSNGNGNLKLDYIQAVCREIGEMLAQKESYHTVVVRSTVLPGTVSQTIIPLLEKHSGKRAGCDFGVAMNPEFLRESSAIEDYYSPAVIVIGELNEESGAAVEHMYETIPAPMVRVDLETAEMVKYVNNAFHALKVTFANEVGSLAKLHGIDSRGVMDILCMDKRLNISNAYLRPGQAFGGSCLPKDVRALVYRAKQKDLTVPLLSSLLPSNQLQIQRSIRMVEQTGAKNVAILGLSFKAGTDDVRESPTIAIVETLVGRGYSVRIYDETVQIDNLTGVNKSFLEREIPHITTLMCNSLEETIAEADVVVVTNGSPIFQQVMYMMKEEQVLIDLVGIDRTNGAMKVNYNGICW